MSQLVLLIAGVARTMRAILGAPDYDRYIEHCCSHHANAKPMTRDQFAKDLLERKYSRPGTRCC